MWTLEGRSSSRSRPCGGARPAGADRPKHVADRGTGAVLDGSTAGAQLGSHTSVVQSKRGAAASALSYA
jgi:hypothetical protein